MADLNSGEKVILKNWITGQATKDTSALLKLLIVPQISGYLTVPVTTNRDTLIVKMEDFVISAGSTVGIQITDTYAQMLTKWTSGINAAATVADKIPFIRNEAKFWAFLGILKTVDVTASGTSTVNTQSGVYYGPKYVDLGLPAGINSNDIENVQR